MSWLKHFFVGFLIGLANLIPGVSGGTFALILGVYERLIGFLNAVDTKSILDLLRLSRAWAAAGFRGDGAEKLAGYLRQRDYPFMAVIGLGALSCIVLLSSLMKYLLTHHFTPTYGYFFGLIVLSVVIPWRMITSFRPALLLPLLAGTLLTVGVTAGVNPYDKALQKSESLKIEYQNQQHTEGHDAPAARLTFSGKYTLGEYLYIFICGVVAISAMVLPGISGSLVLILMNQYFAVISAIANLGNLLLDDLLFLSVMAGGIALGLISFARFIDFAFRKFHDPMISFLIGLIVGSLYALWPFKQAEIIAAYYVKEGAAIERIDNYLVYSNINTWPPDSHSALIALLTMTAGMITMLFFIRGEGKP